MLMRNVSVLPPESFQDGVLIAAAQAGDREAFGELITCYHRQIRTYVTARVNDRHDAEDLAQDVFVIAFSKLREFDPQRPFVSWLRGIARNLVLNYWRKFRADPVGGTHELEGLIQAGIERTTCPGEETEVTDALRLCVERLDDEARELIVKRYQTGISVAELTQHLEIKHSTLTMWLHRIRKKLRHCIERRLVSSSS